MCDDELAVPVKRVTSVSVNSAAPREIMSGRICSQTALSSSIKSVAAAANPTRSLWRRLRCAPVHPVSASVIPDEI